MACYICEYRLPVGVMPSVSGQPATAPGSPLHEPVGSCHKCGVLACPTHGVRPALTTVDEFRCAPCLGLVLTRSGLAGDDGDDDGDEDDGGGGGGGGGGHAVVPPALIGASDAVVSRLPRSAVEQVIARFRSGEVDRGEFQQRLIRALLRDVGEPDVEARRQASSGMFATGAIVTDGDLATAVARRIGVLGNALGHEVARVAARFEGADVQAEIALRDVVRVARGIALALAAHGVTEETAAEAIARPETVPALLSMPALTLWSFFMLGETDPDAEPVVVPAGPVQPSFGGPFAGERRAIAGA